jgi:methyl coenzyme M reductase alpha subunit
MAFVITAPSLLEAAATDLEQVGSALNTADAAAAGATTQIATAGADEVSAAIATLLSGHAQEYQRLSAATVGTADCCSATAVMVAPADSGLEPTLVATAARAATPC